MSRPRSHFREVRATLTLGVPIIVGQVSQMLMGVMDTAMIGHAGAVPMAAASFTNNVFNLFYVIGIGLTIPVAIFVSRARGANSPREAGEYLRHGLAIAVLFGIAEMLLMFALSTQLHRFDQPPEVIAIVAPFYLLFAASLPAVLAYLALRQFAEAMGHPWAPMFIMLAGVGLNAVLNWIFIFGHLGVPALGLTGAGISTLVSRVLGAAVIFAWLRRDPRVRAAWPGFSGGWLAAFSIGRIREMLHLGLPTAGMLLFETTAFAFSGIMMGWLGTLPLAAHQIAFTCASFAFMFPLGLSMAAGIRVSHVIGSAEDERIWPIGFSSITLGFVVMAGFAMLFWIGGTTIAGWFVRDAAVILLAAQLLRFAAVFQLADGVQVISAHLLRGISDVKTPTVITLIAYWGIALPLGYGLGVAGPMGPAGIWTGIASGLIFAAILLTARFARRTRSAASPRMAVTATPVKV